MTENYVLMTICLSTVFIVLVFVLALKTKKH